jgi:hypothetical protein
MKYTFFILIIFLNSASTFAINIIINSENTEAAFDKLAIKDIYLGQTLFWDDGSNIFVADYLASNELRKNFSKTILGVPPNKVYLNWIRISLSGKGAPPKIFHSEDEVIRFVEENPSAIGYLDKSLPAGNKAIKIVTIEN